MKIFLIYMFLLPFLLIAKENPDIITMASSKKCGKKSCRNDQICIKEKCYYMCDSQYPNDGVCRGREIACDNGECKDVCSQDRPNGPCKDPSTKCDNGECVDNSCSQDRPNGYCYFDHICEDGKCKDNTCSKNRPNGYCEKGRECEDGKCEEPGGCNYSNNSINYFSFLFFLSFYILLRKLTRSK